MKKIILYIIIALLVISNIFTLITVINKNNKINTYEKIYSIDDLINLLERYPNIIEDFNKTISNWDLTLDNFKEELTLLKSSREKEKIINEQIEIILDDATGTIILIDKNNNKYINITKELWNIFFNEGETNNEE